MATPSTCPPAANSSEFCPTPTSPPPSASNRATPCSTPTAVNRGPLRQRRGRYGDEALPEFAQALAPTAAVAAVAAIRDLLDTFGTDVDDDTAVLALNVPRTTSEEQL